VVSSSALNLLGGYLVGVNMARSWTRWQAAAMVTYAALQGVFIVSVNLATTTGVLTFGLLSAGAGLAIQSTIGLVGFWHPERVSWN
jgi:hypothetical protein